MSTQENTQGRDSLIPSTITSIDGFRVSFILFAIAVAIVYISWIFDPGLSTGGVGSFGAMIVGP
jgi:hypothetical protein